MNLEAAHFEIGGSSKGNMGPMGGRVTIIDEEVNVIWFFYGPGLVW